MLGNKINLSFFYEKTQQLSKPVTKKKDTALRMKRHNS